MKTLSMKSLPGLALAALAVAMPAYALMVSGVNVPDRASVDNASLMLNGAGLRTKFVLADVYVAALYLPQKSSDAAQIVSAQEPRRIELRMKRGVDSDTMVKAFHEGVQRNLSAQEMTQIQPKLGQLDQSFSKYKQLKEGDVLDLDFGSDGGTRVSYNGEVQNVIPGTELSSALLKIWLGKNPVQDDLKQKLLGAQS
jgi:Chalcone isomerase-like